MINYFNKLATPPHTKLVRRIQRVHELLLVSFWTKKKNQAVNRRKNILKKKENNIKWG